MITAVTVVLGVIVGVVSAFYGGLLDNILMRIVDVFLTLPFIMAALILAAVLTPKLGRSVMPAVIALSCGKSLKYLNRPQPAKPQTMTQIKTTKPVKNFFNCSAWVKNQ